MLGCLELLCAAGTLSAPPAKVYCSQIVIVVAVCIGPFWMLYDWFVRKAKRTWNSWMWLFFVSWGFLWYYFEKYRVTEMVN